jgi:hypothetical protein
VHQLNLVVVQEAMKEFAGGETKPTLGKGSFNYNLFGIGSGAP